MEDFDFLDDDVKLPMSWLLEYGIPRRIYYRPQSIEELDELSFSKTLTSIL
ncbi:unnamed protein product, partial [Callosobruchus maculatus]